MILRFVQDDTLTKHMPRKVVFGFVGQMGSGKGTVAKYLEEKYGASTYRFSSIVRDVAKRLYLSENRDTLVKMSEALRAAFGENIFAKVIAEDAAHASNSIIMLDGIRRVSDIDFELPNFVLVEVFANMETRLKRIQARGENPDDATLTMEQFTANHERSTEKSIAEIAERATERIDNNGSSEELYKQIDALVEKYTA